MKPKIRQEQKQKSNANVKQNLSSKLHPKEKQITWNKKVFKHTEGHLDLSKMFQTFFLQMWLMRKLEWLVQVTNINQLPKTNGITSPPKDAVTNTFSF